MIDEVQYLRAGLAERDAEIERLRAALAGSEMQLASNYRSRIIEECARVAEVEEARANCDLGIPAAIRALKDKP